MQKQTSIYIPKPCHEDWNKMTPTQQGKFCASCNKQVVDFSVMSDNQILNFLSNQSGKLCGRFDAEQLQRPLIETKIKKKKSWWVALTMPLLFLFDRSEAQKPLLKQKHQATQTIKRENVLLGDVAVQTIKNTTSSIEKQLTGKVMICEPNEITIKGKVIDENNNPLPYASIIKKGTIYGTTTDSLGNFSIKANSYLDSITLTASYVGYSSTETNVKLENKDISGIIIVLPEYVTTGLAAVVTSYSTKQWSGTVGGLTVCRKMSALEKVDTIVRKVFNISSFKIYPNPVIKVNPIHLEIKQAGTYQMQLLDDQSRLIMVEEINTDSDKSTTQIQLPSNIASGIYYLRLIDERKKKSYTEKLIVQ